MNFKDFMKVAAPVMESTLKQLAVSMGVAFDSDSLKVTVTGSKKKTTPTITASLELREQKKKRRSWKIIEYANTPAQWREILSLAHEANGGGFTSLLPKFVERFKQDQGKPVHGSELRKQFDLFGMQKLLNKLLKEKQMPYRCAAVRSAAFKNIPVRGCAYFQIVTIVEDS